MAYAMQAAPRARKQSSPPQMKSLRKNERRGFAGSLGLRFRVFVLATVGRVLSGAAEHGKQLFACPPPLVSGSARADRAEPGAFSRAPFPGATSRSSRGFPKGGRP